MLSAVLGLFTITKTDGVSAITVALLSPLVNVYHIALGRRSVIKTYRLRLGVEDSFRT